MENATFYFFTSFQNIKRKYQYEIVGDVCLSPCDPRGKLVKNKIARCFVFLNSCPASIYLFEVNKTNTRKRCELYSKLTIKLPELRH